MQAHIINEGACEMSLAAERIGDKGQRYVVKFRDSETGVERILGYCNHEGGAYALADAWRQRPEGSVVWVVDREQFDGIGGV